MAGEFALDGELARSQGQEKESDNTGVEEVVEDEDGELAGDGWAADILDGDVPDQVRQGVGQGEENDEKEVDGESLSSR